MNLKESATIVAILQTAYPDHYRAMSDDMLASTIRLWCDMFAAEPVKVVRDAVAYYIQTSPERFAPNIGQIKETIRKMTQPQQMTELEAWGLVMNALRNGSYGYMEEYAKLPPAVQRCVGSAYQLREWAQMDTEEVSTVVASNFQRSFRAVSRQEAEWAKLPEAMRENMRALTGQIFKPMLED